METNPFSTTRVRPGAIEYALPAEVKPTQLIERLRQQDWKGQILGPHGSGKSTLLATLGPLLTEAGRQIVWVALHEGERRLPFSGSDRQSWNDRTVIVIDGYEQLGWWSRWRLRRQCIRHQSGLLVTAHEPAGLPLLWRTEDALAQVPRVIQAILPEGQERIDLPLIQSVLESQEGNVREALFALYDLWEATPDDLSQSKARSPTASDRVDR